MDAPSEPIPLTADEAIARLDTWTEGPSEDFDDRLLLAALAAADTPSAETQADLRVSAEAWRRARVERVQTATGSFGCAMDAEDVRCALRSSSMIVEVVPGRPPFGHAEGSVMVAVMLRARGCRIAYLDADGRWRGVGSREREQ